MLSVAVIGAGPSGLVAAAKLLRYKDVFKVTVYEKSLQIGGLWAVDPPQTDNMISPTMPTNLSKYSVAFSDLAWDSVPGKEEDPINLFPKARHVDRYLHEYARRHVPSESLLLGKELVKAEHVSDNGKTTWSLTFKDAINPSEFQSATGFDRLVIASGFYANAQSLSAILPKGVNIPESPAAPVLHSTRYRVLADIGYNATSKNPLNVLIIGGANSGAETASLIAHQSSAVEHAPPHGNSRPVGKIVHLVARPMLNTNRIVASSASNVSFLPVDFPLSDLAKRPPEPINFQFGVSEDANAVKNIHKLYRSLFGEQRYAMVGHSTIEGQRPVPYGAITDGYAEFMHSGLVEQVTGRLVNLVYEAGSNNGRPQFSAEYSHNGEKKQITEIDAVVYATGFEQGAALECLPDEIKEKLHYSATEKRLPLILERDFTSSSAAVPDLAFVGCYEGPYWASMEAQARLVVKRWRDEALGVQPELPEPVVPASKFEGLRKAMREDRHVVPQFLYFDNLGLLESSARVLKDKRSDISWGDREGPCIPARYLENDADRSESDTTVTAVQKMLDNSENHGLYAALATFRALLGPWQIHRELKSSRPDFPSGVLTGTARFESRAPTAPDFDLEYLYIEQGELQTQMGKMAASRRYVYRYSEEKDILSVWFVKQDNYTVDYHYHDITFKTPTPPKPGPLQAAASHLCINDMYHSEYRFWFDRATISKFEVGHEVKGPAKDYTSTTTYTRALQPKLSDEWQTWLDS